MSDFLKEACVESYDQSLKALNGGASQIELCTQLEVDGLTPSLSLAKKIVEELKIPTKVMIRNRAGDFVYNHSDLQEMQQQITAFKTLDIQGFVLGALTLENNLDFDALSILCQVAQPYPVTVHKCVDLLSEITQLQRLKEISNIKFVLSSGGETTAQKGIERLKQMAALLNPQIQIIPAGKITSRNVQNLHAVLGAKIYHGKKIVF